MHLNQYSMNNKILTNSYYGVYNYPSSQMITERGQYLIENYLHNVKIMERVKARKEKINQIYGRRNG